MPLPQTNDEAAARIRRSGFQTVQMQDLNSNVYIQRKGAERNCCRA